MTLLALMLHSTIHIWRPDSSVRFASIPSLVNSTLVLNYLERERAILPEARGHSSHSYEILVLDAQCVHFCVLHISTRIEERFRTQSRSWDKFTQ